MELRNTNHSPHETYAFVLFYTAYVSRIDVEKNSWNTDYLVFDTLFQEYKAIVERTWELRNVSPDVKCSGRNPFDINTNASKFS